MFTELKALRRQLDQCGTLPSKWEERRPIFMELDRLLGEPCSENNPELLRFYTRMAEAALDEIREYPADGAPRLWKFYSSGIIFRDAKGRTIGVDVNDGVCESDSRRNLLVISDALADEIADTVDIMFYTHPHQDHIGLKVAAALERRRKPLVIPKDGIGGYLLGSNAIPSEEFYADYVSIYHGWQRMAAADDSPNAAFLFQVAPDMTLFLRGDIFMAEDFMPILEKMAEENRKVSIAAISHFFQSGRPPVDILKERYNCGFIPIHEWEFSHRPLGKAGAATQNYARLYEVYGPLMPGYRVAPLAWGESIDMKVLCP